MGRTVAIGIQNFDEIIEKNCFYVDKTNFIREWWESEDSVTLITRPRRFGKTLTMSMVEQFFSVNYAGRGDLFEGLSIWNEEKYRSLQGTYPVISLSFANVKETDFKTTSYRIRQLLMKAYEQNTFFRECEKLSDAEIKYFLGIDGGGTKTEFVLIDANNKQIASLVFGPTNPIDIGIENALGVLQQGINQICKGIRNKEISVFAGLSGGNYR